MLEKGLFVGKDQKIMNFFIFKTTRNQVVRLPTWKLNCKNSNYDKWFFYQKYFSSNKFYD